MMKGPLSVGGELRFGGGQHPPPIGSYISPKLFQPYHSRDIGNYGYPSSVARISYRPDYS